MKRLILASALLLATLPAFAGKRDYAIDPGHTMVLASWSHFGFSNPMANFGGARGTISFDDAKPADSSVNVEIPIAQLDSFVPELDTHLKGKDFFDAEQFPTATFTSTRVIAKGKNQFEVRGTLTLRGVSKPVVLNAVLNKRGLQPMLGKQAIGFDATAAIRRSDFGISEHVPMVGDVVMLRITTEAHAE